MKGDGIPLTPASGPLLPRKDLFAGLLAPGFEELPQQGGAFIAAHPAEYVDAMPELGLARQVDGAAAGTGFRIPGTEYHPRNSCAEYGAHAHSACFEDRVKSAPAEPVIAQVPGARAQRHDFRM